MSVSFWLRRSLATNQNNGGATVAEAASTTQFIGDAEVADARPTNALISPTSQTKVSLAAVGLKEFLSKPIMLESGTYGVATVAHSVVSTIDVGSALLLTPLWKDKWKGQLNFRGTAVFRLTINAMPFQAGLLMLKVLPGSMLSSDVGIRTRSITQYSQLPGVTFSLSQTEATLRVPYRSPADFYELSYNGFTWGHVYLVAYTSMRTAATSAQDCDWTLWLSWEDVELQTPTLPQGGSTPVPRSDKGIRKLKSRTPAESEVNEGKGPLSLILGGGSKIAKGLGFIPCLSAIMSPASWYLNAAAGFASSLGWSKPVASGSPHRVTMNAHIYGTTFDGEDMSSPLAMSADNNVIPIDTMGYTDEDEMSLDYVKTRWSYCNFPGSLVWDSTSTGAIWSSAVKPNMGDQVLIDATADGPLTYVHATPVGFVSRLFQLWRGSLTLRFRFAKTSFHSGRLQLVYSPGPSNFTAPTQYDWCLREIIDIREGDTFCFTLPYARAQTWLNFDEAMGYVTLAVVNPLRAASSVSSSIDFIVEVCGGQDLEFSVPRNTNLAPLTPQMDEGGGTEEISCGMVGSATVPHFDGKCQETTGETVRSLKQFILRFSRVFMFTSDGTPTSAEGGVYPYYLGGFKSTADGIDRGAISGDYLSLVCSLYAYNRGSIRLRTIEDARQATTVVALSVPGQTTAVTNRCDIGISNFLGDELFVTKRCMNFPHAIFPQSLYGGWTVHVPAYQICRMRTTQMHFTLTSGDGGRDINSMSVHWKTIGAEPAIGSCLQRAAGDDFQCGLFLCIPPLLVSINYV